MNASVRHLPLAMSWLAPEITSLDWPDEPQADCAHCPLEGKPFLRDIRCCTYEPAVPNFLVGRALRRLDAGSDQVRARLQRPEGVSAWGIRPSASWTAEYEANRDQGFGRNPAWRCPYWVKGPLSCSIWRDRNSACRTWHCKHEEGVRAHHLWTAGRTLLHAVEQRLAAWCSTQGTPPTSARVDDWVTWFLSCADAVDRIEAQELQTLHDEELNRLREALRQANAHRAEPIPEILGVEVREARDHGEEVELVGYTPWNTRRFPRKIFVLLSKFDGARSRAEALQAAQAEDPGVQGSWIRSLWDIDVLRAPGDPSVPWGFESPDLDPEALVRAFPKPSP